VHSIDTHLYSLIKQLPTDVNTYLHFFSDGRDVPPTSGADFMEAVENFIVDYPHVIIASVAGRYYGMDRDNNWDRIQKAYDEIMFGQLQTNDKPSEHMRKTYLRELTDEFLPPVNFMDGEQIEDGDAIFFLNFRSDRARQLTQALMVSQDESIAKSYPTRSPYFMPKQIRNLYLVTMTNYYKEYTGLTFIKG
jgi:2,3-bisphosphoglycerate-independent phosphoglycerate mutase